MTRKELIEFITDNYNTKPDYPFDAYPDVAVFRHSSNRKWFAVIMTVSGTRLGLAEKGSIDIVNVKCAAEIMDSFLTENGIFPAYHMNKNHWLSVVLDGSVDNDTVGFLIDVSHGLTAPKISKKRKQ